MWKAWRGSKDRSLRSLGPYTLWPKITPAKKQEALPNMLSGAGKNRKLHASPKKGKTVANAVVLNSNVPAFYPLFLCLSLSFSSLQLSKQKEKTQKRWIFREKKRWGNFTPRCRRWRQQPFLPTLGSGETHLQISATAEREDPVFVCLNLIA